MLTGKYKRNAKPPPHSRGADHSWFRQIVTAENVAKVNKLKRIAAARNKTVGQLALAWLIGRDEITAPIVGPRNTGQLRDNLGGSGWTLKDREREEIEAICI